MSYSVITLAKELISRPSLTPDDAGCLDLISQYLADSGFTIERMPFGDTDNLWAWHGDASGPTLMMAGHTDIVPPGNEELWHYPPFEPTIHNDMLYGRGAADMKGSLAAMVCAVQQFVTAQPHHRGRIAFLLTSDEEGCAHNGTIKVVQALMKREEQVDYCLVGEPSCNNRVGDTIKHGRRGSLTVDLTISGVQGHVAYPHLAHNPIHSSLAALQELTAMEWDQGNDFFPPTNMQITQIQAGTGRNNVIPGQLYVQINFRFSTESTPEEIQQRLEAILHQHQIQFQANWDLSGEPFLTGRGELVQAMEQAIKHYTGLTPQLLTTGGTSDGRFIFKMGAQVAEFGPINSTIHQVNECVSISDLQLLTQIYQNIMEQLLV